MARLTQAVAERPYTRVAESFTAEVKIKLAGKAWDIVAEAYELPREGEDGGEGGDGGGGGGGGRDRTAVGTWWAMLQAVPRIGAAQATKIVLTYPTLRSLVDAYRAPGTSEAEKRRLLERVAAPEGKRATKLSSDIFTWLTSQNPDALVGEA